MSDDGPPGSPWDRPYQGDPPPDTSYREPQPGQPPPPYGQQDPCGHPNPYDQQPPYGAPGGHACGGAPGQKSHATRTVLLILLGVGVLFLGGCAALVIGLVAGVDDAVEEGIAGGDPVVVEEGAAFSFDGFDAGEGWSVERERFGGWTVDGLRVTATEKGPRGGGRSSLLIFRFYDGTENIAEITCSGNQVRAGESSRLDCFSADAVPRGYDEIRVGGY